MISVIYLAHILSNSKSGLYRFLSLTLMLLSLRELWDLLSTEVSTLSYFHPNLGIVSKLISFFFFAPRCCSFFAPSMTKWWQFLNRIEFPTPAKAVIYRVSDLMDVNLKTKKLIGFA